MRFECDFVECDRSAIEPRGRMAYCAMHAAEHDENVRALITIVSTRCWACRRPCIAPAYKLEPLCVDCQKGTDACTAND